jgi:hypothetical protein
MRRASGRVSPCMQARIAVSSRRAQYGNDARSSPGRRERTTRSRRRPCRGPA